MIFLFKKTQITVDCFTDSSSAFEHSKIQEATKFLPQWWKNLPKQIDDGKFFPSPTMKTCAGFVDLYKSGFILPMWSELAVRLGEVGSSNLEWQYADFSSNASFHTSDQYGSYLSEEKYTHFKLRSPWIVQCKSSLKTSFTQPTFNMQVLDDYVILPGVVDFKTRPRTNINLFFVRDAYKEKNINIDFNTPMIHFVPLTEHKIKLKHHLISESEMNNKEFKKTHFINSYAKQLDKKCPAHNF